MERLASLSFVLIVLVVGLSLARPLDAEDVVAPEIDAAPVTMATIGFLPVAGGTFTMGCLPSKDKACSFAERPGHEVTVSPFQIMITEVTNAAFAAFLQAHGNDCGDMECIDAADVDTQIHLVDGSWTSDEGKAAFPVIEVPWYGAQAYCAWAGGSLCTEAQWELAARGTTSEVYPWGSSEATCGLAVMNEGGMGCGTGDPAPVGSKPAGASPYGALDMAGNVWEWVADWYAPYDDDPLTDPTGPTKGTYKLIKGGSFGEYGSIVRSAFRHYDLPGHGGSHVGFRCCKEAP